MRGNTAKSKMFTADLSSLVEDNSEILPEQPENQVNLDLATIIRPVVKIPNTLRDIALQLLFLSSTIPCILPAISTKVYPSKVVNAVNEVMVINL